MPYPVAPRLASPNVIPAYMGNTTDTVIQLAAQPGFSIANMFGSGTTLTANVWEGQSQALLASPVVIWWTNGGAQLGYDVGQVLISPAFGDVASLDPAGQYRVVITGTTSGEQTVIADCQFKVIATPGTVSPNPPDLISYDYCLSQLTGVNLTAAQLDLVPWLVSAASQAWRLECNERNFDQRTYVEWQTVALDGYCRLSQTPIQIITRCQGIPQLALTISNNSTSVQTAQAYFSYTGYDGGTGVNAKTATGVVLNWTSNGVPSTANLLFSAYPTIGALASAITAVGVGWLAQVDTGYSEWACTELVGGFVAQGCTQYSIPADGAQFSVLLDLTMPELQPGSPLLWVGQQYSGNQYAQQWGPGGLDMWGQTAQQIGVVKVTYIAGYNPIPPEVQYQVSQIVKWKLELNVQELLLKSEAAAEYRYNLAEDMVHNLPRTVREAAGRWKQYLA